MKKRMAILLVLLLLATSCGQAEEKDGATDATTQGAGTVSSDTEATSSGDASDQNKQTAEGIDFDGRKGVIQGNQELEKFGIHIRLDYVYIDDHPGLFDPPPDGMIFLYPVFTITNNNENEQGIYFMTSSSCVATIDGEEYGRTMEALYSYEGRDMNTLDTDVNKGQTVQAYTGMTVPEDWKEIQFLVKQAFDANTQPVNMVFELKRNSGNAKDVQIMAKEEEILPAAPRLMHVNYLTKEEIEEVTGLHVIGTENTEDEVWRAGATYLLHEDASASATSSKTVRLDYRIYYPKDELTAEDWSVLGAEAFFKKEKEGSRFLETVPQLGDDAYWAMNYVQSNKELRILHRDEQHGPHMIVLEAKENGDEAWLIPLGKKMLIFLKDQKERVAP